MLVYPEQAWEQARRGLVTNAGTRHALAAEGPGGQVLTVTMISRTACVQP